MRKYKFVDKFTGSVSPYTLIIHGDGKYSAEPEEYLQSFSEMLNWMDEDDPKPNSIFDFIKSGLYDRSVRREDEDGNLVPLTEED